MSAFERMHRFLEEKKSFWLTLLDDLEIRIEKKHEENVVILSDEIFYLTQLITEIEGKSQQPANEFLQVRFKTSVEGEPVWV